MIKPVFRCFGTKKGQELYADYHDREWGVPVHDERILFEMLVLEGAQAGLSWETVLKKRDGYRAAFYNFDVAKVAKMPDRELEAHRENKDIIRNRLKIYATRQNAQVFINIQKEFSTFDRYIWQFVHDKPVQNAYSCYKDIPVKTPISKQISKDLRKRGMSFVGPTIIYAYMQAIGMVNDHLISCFRHEQLKS